MRPVELVVEGFGPFRDRVSIDFTDADFFALVGPTGAGKSSVIDAICFALYGMVPRYDDRRLVAPAITTGAGQAKIQFSFDCGGQRYVATRVVRRTAKGATTKECRLERPATGEVLAGDPDGLTVRVQEILGLTPEHFTRCVVLPQGEFAKFLHDKPAERQKLLVELLGLEVYGRMASTARGRAATAKTRADALDSELADLADATAQAQRDAAARLADLGAMAERAHQAQGPVDAQRLTIAGLERHTGTQRELLGKLRDIQVPPEVDELAIRLGLADQHRDTTGRAADHAEEAAQKAEALANDAQDPGDLASLVGTWTSLTAERTRLPAARSTVDHAKAAMTAATEARQAAEHALGEAQARREQTEEAHAAHALAVSLEVGKECPVCLVPVARIPDLKMPADLEAIRAESAALTALLHDARQDENAASTGLVGAQGTLADLHDRCTAWEQQLQGIPSQETLQADLLKSRQLRSEANRLRREATQARDAHGQAEAARNNLHAQQQQSSGAFTRQRDAVSSLQPPAPTDALAADWHTLAGWAADRIQTAETTITELIQELDSHRDSLRGILTGLTEDCHRLQVPITDDSGYEQIVLAVNRAEVAAQSNLDTVTAQRRRKTALLDEQKRLRADAEVANTLAHLLSARGFESWVLAEALSELVAGASVTLRELSQGAYSLTLSQSNEFMVIDHREADAIRPARTLSGGETFQASLALALALADHLGQFAAGGSSQLESIFLDEGFGTLDEDSLDVVASTLETLASGDRMVGLITHVKELALRVPVRFEVRKEGRTAVVERATA